MLMLNRTVEFAEQISPNLAVKILSVQIFPFQSICSRKLYIIGPVGSLGASMIFPILMTKWHRTDGHHYETELMMLRIYI